MRNTSAAAIRTKGDLKFRAIKAVLKLRSLSRAYGQAVSLKQKHAGRFAESCSKCKPASTDSSESDSNHPLERSGLGDASPPRAFETRVGALTFPSGTNRSEATRSNTPWSRISAGATTCGCGKSSSALLTFFPTAAIATLTILLLTYSLFSNPFPDNLASKTISLTPLTHPQRINIAQAAGRINGYVLKPGEHFSFNGVVGPRTGNRGFQPARSYIGSESPETLGGGICLLSSCLYQAALETRLQIEERVPHLRTVRTVPPGLDATVWYGKADLRFKNTTNHPLQIKAVVLPNELKLQLAGTASSSNEVLLKRYESRRAGHQLLVEVFRTEGGHDELISRDVYRTR